MTLLGTCGIEIAAFITGCVKDFTRLSDSAAV